MGIEDLSGGVGVPPEGSDQAEKTARLLDIMHRQNGMRAEDEGREEDDGEDFSSIDPEELRILKLRHPAGDHSDEDTGGAGRI